MRIYIRHAEKEYKNGKKGVDYPFDPSLTENGSKKAAALAESFYSSYGLPTLIIVSPFLRARQTALIIRSRLIELTKKEIPVVCDRRIGEYLGNHKISMTFTPKTTSLNPLIENNISSFNVRVREHNDILGALDDENFNIWVVTHGLVIKNLCKFNGCPIFSYPDFLAGIRIDKKISTFGNWKVNTFLPYGDKRKL